jgi:succinate-acetate transporter protein
MSAPQVTPPLTGNGAPSSLADVVLTTPEHGRGYFYPATAAGTPLALIAFGVTFGLLSMGNAEWYSLNALGIVAPACFGLGAFGLIIGGLWDFRGGNMFAATWEITYGAFWVFVGLFLGIFGAQVGAAAGAAGAADAFGSYLFIWAIVTAGFTVGTYYVARPAFIAFALTTLVFLLLGIANISAPSDMSDSLRQIAGYAGILASATVIYLAFALLLNDLLGRQILPIWPYTG